MGNREYKSDVFCMLLEDKKNALALYNAINGSNHTNPEMVEICTLYNINKGYNEELLGSCTFLKEYMQFIECVQLYVNMYGKQKLTLALKTAIDECIENDILEAVLSSENVNI